MSSLCSLLNPAPSSTDPAPSKAQQLAPLQLDGQDHRSHAHLPEHRIAQSPIHHSVTSPGLDVLATAASKTAPLMSPTQQQSSMAQAMYPGQIQKASESETKAGMLPGSHILSNLDLQKHPQSLAQYEQLGIDRNPRMQDCEDDSSKTHAAFDQALTTGNDPPATMSSIFSSHYRQPDNTRPGDSAHVIAHAQDQPNTVQIREPQISDLPSLSTDFATKQMDQFQVKTELTEAPRMKNSMTMPTNSSATFSHDSTPGTPLKIAMSNVSPDPTSQTEDSAVIVPKPKSAPSKKRPAPKKGNTIKPPAKKRKVETESGKATPRTGTPATSRASGTPGPKKGKQDSATPTRSPSIANPEDDEDDGEPDGKPELFCICRKPDDHTVMIGCDGPCEDWFHTRCVNMSNEKVALISKWYCPNCAAEGHETEWKRMCRLGGCSKPALTDGPHRSKYCCKDHGQEFIERHLSANEKKSGGLIATRKRRRDNYTDHDGNEVDENDDQDDNRGGVLRSGELKALVDGVKDIVTFRKLGDGVLSPPETAVTSPGREVGVKIAYNPEEAHLLDEVGKKRAELEARRDMLSDRETLVHMVDRRRKDVLTKLKEKEKSLKDICGYDARLTWSDEELNEWRKSKEGQDQLQNNILNTDPALMKASNAEKGGEGGEAEIGPGVCKKKRCERHRTWYKVQQQDNAMEREHVRQKLKKLDEEEKGVRERAMIRNLEEGHELVN